MRITRSIFTTLLLALLVLFACACTATDSAGHTRQFFCPPVAYYNLDTATKHSVLNVGLVAYHEESGTSGTWKMITPAFWQWAEKSGNTGWFALPLLTYYSDGEVENGVHQTTLFGPLYNRDHLVDPLRGERKVNAILLGLVGSWVTEPNTFAWSALSVFISYQNTPKDGRSFWLFPLFGIYDAGFFTPVAGYTNNIQSEAERNHALLYIRDDLARFGTAKRNLAKKMVENGDKVPSRTLTVKEQVRFRFVDHWHALLLVHQFRELAFKVREDSSLDQIKATEIDTRSFYVFPFYGRKTRPDENYASNSVLWPLFNTTSHNTEREWRIFHFIRFGDKIGNTKPVKPVSPQNK